MDSTTETQCPVTWWVHWRSEALCSNDRAEVLQAAVVLQPAGRAVVPDAKVERVGSVQTQSKRLQISARDRRTPSRRGKR